MSLIQPFRFTEKARRCINCNYKWSCDLVLANQFYLLQINTTYTLEAKLEASSCLMLAVRGYNKAMLYSTAYKEFKGCSVPDRYQLLVLDAVGETLIDGTTG